MFAGTSREISSVAVGMEGNDSRNAQLLLAGPHGTLAHPLPALTLHGLKAGSGYLSQELLGTLVLGSSGLVALVTSGQASPPHIPMALPDIPGRSYLPGRAGSCAPSPPGSPRAVGKQYQSRSEGTSRVSLGHACSPGSGLGAVLLPVLPLHPKGCSDPVPKPIPLSSSITRLTCTSKGFITVSTRPWAGTTGISLPQNSLELRASVLTVMLTSPADASRVLSPHRVPPPAHTAASRACISRGALCGADWIGMGVTRLRSSAGRRWGG